MDGWMTGWMVAWWMDEETQMSDGGIWCTFSRRACVPTTDSMWMVWSDQLGPVAPQSILFVVMTPLAGVVGIRGGGDR